MSVRRTQLEVDSSEFAEWIAFDRMETWTESYKDFLVAGIIASEIHNSFQLFVPKGKRKFRKPEDYIPEWVPSQAPIPDEVQTETAEVQEEIPAPDPEELFLKMSAAFRSFGGVDTRRKKPN